MPLDLPDHAASPKRVAIMGSYAPSLINFRGPLISELVARGHAVFTLAPDIDPAVQASLIALGAKPISVPLDRGSLNPRGAMRSRRAIASVFQQVRPDVVIAYTIGPIVLGAAAARSVGARFIPLVTGLGYAFLGGRSPKRLAIRLAAILMYRRAFRLAQSALFQNDDDRRDFARLRIIPPGLPTSVINGSGVDLKHFSPRPLPDEPSFLMIGRFLKDKGVREYAAAAARLKVEFLNAKFRLAGWRDQSPDAISEDELNRISEMGVEMLGKLEDVRPAIASCRVYVLPSYREGTPRSVLEAMAMGRAVVTTNAPGCRETVIEGKNGFLVPPADSQALYLAMRQLLEVPFLAEKMGRISRQLAEEKFDVALVNRAIIDHADL